MKYYQLRPFTQAITDRVVLILTEEANKAEANKIPKFIEKTAKRLVEVIVDEINHGQVK